MIRNHSLKAVPLEAVLRKGCDTRVRWTTVQAPDLRLNRRAGVQNKAHTNVLVLINYCLRPIAMIR
jgi:hypothetical protein